MQVTETQLRSWMTAGLDGDAAAHAAMLRALVPLLRSFYRRRLRDADDDIEDLIQETLISIHSRRESYDRERPFTAWLYAIARYRMIDHLRRQKASVPIEDVEEMLVAEGFADATGARLDVETLLSTLSAKQARTIRAAQLEGLSVTEIARRDGIGESDVKVSVHRGLKALAARIAGGRP